MYDCLVLSAGGTYGAAYVGAIKALEARGVMRRVRRVHGTSAGAIVATMAAAGIDGSRMEAIMADFCAAPRPKPDFRRLRRDFGCADAGAFLDAALDAFLPPDATFATLARHSGVNLSVHAYSVSERKVVDFGLDATPDQAVREAVAASCCVPFVFAPVRIGGARYVDGAVAQRTPMHMIVDPSGTLVLDVRDSARGEPPDVVSYLGALMSATSRYIGPFSGDFVTIEVPPGPATLPHLSPPLDALAPVVAAGFEAVEAACAARALRLSSRRASRR